MKYYTAKALGRVLGVGEERIQLWMKSGVIREGRAENGLFRLEESAREIIAGLENADGARECADYAAERAGLMRIKRKNAEYDLRLREKDLHATEDVETIVTQILVRFRAKVRAIPARTAAQCARLENPEDVYELLKKVTDEALEELADLEKVFETENDVES